MKKQYWYLAICMMLISISLIGCRGNVVKETEDSVSAGMNSKKAKKLEKAAKKADDEEKENSEMKRDEGREETENNGGYFLRIGERIYFRQYGAKALGTVALQGDFLSDPVPADDSKLCFYDKKHGQVKEAFADQGYGPLYFYEGRFYLTEIFEDEPGLFIRQIYSVLPDGSERLEIAEGDIVCQNPENGVLATEFIEEGGVWQLSCWDKNNLVNYVRSEEGEKYYEEGESCSVEGGAGEYVFFLKDFYSDDRADQLWALKLEAGAEPVKLGSFLNNSEENEGTYGNIGEIVQRGEEIYLIYENIGLYTDTVQNSTVYKAVLGKENSLSQEVLSKDELAVKGSEEEMRSAEHIKLWINEKGALSIGKHAPYEVWIEGKELFYCDETGNQKALDENFISEEMSGSEEQYFLQRSEYVDGALWCMCSTAEREASGDIGEREAYKQSGIYYLRFELTEAKQGGKEEQPEILGKTVLK